MSDVPATEARNPQTGGLDEMPTLDLVQLLAGEQRAAVTAVLGAVEVLARAVDEIATRLRDGGRLHYVGAGTSGRLGYLDASEMPPTFGTDPALVCAHIAGGPSALTRAIEGAEDDYDAGAREMQGHVGERDAVVGISASGGAPFVAGALHAARTAGAWTLAVQNNPGGAIALQATSNAVLQTGPEPLTGSTRLKAGTAQKIFLNTLSTAVMVRLGKVHDNLMVDVVATNAKLRRRALRLVVQLTGLDETDARALLERAGGNVKVAVVMSARGVEVNAARALLARSGGSLRRSLSDQ